MVLGSKRNQLTLINVRFKPLWSTSLTMVGDFFFLSFLVFSALFFSLILISLLMDAALEGKWKKFSLLEEEKGILAVSS